MSGQREEVECRPQYAVVFREIREALEEAAGDRILVGIDGNCAAGKTTLAQKLQEYFGGTVFHMDDYFLRPVQRTRERLCEPGGNVDYERFREEILVPLCEGKTVAWRPYNCRTGQLGPWRQVTPGRLVIIEGSYSLHPYFGEIYQKKYFMECDAKEQIRRIRQRNGEEQLAVFRERWIPLEEQYFAAFHIREHAVCIR